MELKETPVAKVRCPDCHGTKKIGNIEEAVPGEPHTLGDFRSECDLCNGTGKVSLAIYNKTLDEDPKIYMEKLRRQIYGN